MSFDKPEDLRERIRDLQGRLDEAEETLRALRSGEVDAIVAAGPDGDRVYTLKGADETYRVMVQGMAEGALTLTIDGLILFANEQFATILRTPLERVIGTRIQQLVAPEDADTVSTLLSGEGGRKAEVRLRLDDAAFLPVYFSIQKVVLDGAECHCLLVTDLSAQKRYEEIVALMEAVPAGVFIAQDPECRRIVGNRVAYELLRLPAGAPLSAMADETPKTWREVRDGKEIPERELPMPIAVRTGQPVRDYELDIVFDDGTSRCWLGNAVPLFDKTGQARGAVGTFIDITDRKQAEEALEAVNAELRDFANALTSDLQEPLRMLVSATQLLAQEYEGKLGEDADKYISHSAEGALRMQALLNALHRYWQVTKRSGDSLSPVNCDDLLSQALLKLKTEIRASGAVVTSDPLPTLVADDFMLSQVFHNLIENSIKYRSAATPRIHVSAVRAGERWLFSVRDNGIGIDPDNTERVFGIFQRLPGEAMPGIGSGLALCRKVVERHGGRIWVASEPGHGSAFRFTLPIYLDSALPGLSSLGLVPKSADLRRN